MTTSGEPQPAGEKQEAEAPTPTARAASVNLLHSHFAYFFVPLPEPLGLPDRYMVPCFAPTPGPVYRTHEAEGLAPPNADYVAASLVFHRVTSRRVVGDDLAVLFSLAHRALPAPQAEGADQAGRAEGPPELPPALTAGTPSCEMSVVEMVVAFNDEPDDDDAHMAALTDAFDRGLAYVREVQRAYYLLRRRPLRLAAREAMPFAVPLGIRRLVDADATQRTFEAPLSLFLLNQNAHGGVRDDEMDEAEAQGLRRALAQQSVGSFVTEYLEFVRETQVALWSDGAYRAAALFAATACEVLFDGLLAHLMWEEGMRPEDAAPVFDASFITARVKSQYQQRLGGQWRVDKPGPIMRWSDDVAGLRNRVVHAGYEPTLAEAQASADAAGALAAHLGDLLARCTSKYPRTALFLPGEAGLRRRGAWTKRVRALQKDKSEVHWLETYARWRTAMQRARSDSSTRLLPDPAVSWLYAVIRPEEPVQWVLHDSRAEMAAVIQPAQVTGVTAEHLAGLDEIRETSLREGVHGAVPVRAAPGVTVPDPEPGHWLPQYRLVPMAGVMVDGNDLDPI